MACRVACEAKGPRLKTEVQDDLPRPDLCIRTGGDARISNFMLWHFAYTELYFTDTLWPDFTESEFARALAEYSRRERRYGLRDPDGLGAGGNANA